MRKGLIILVVVVAAVAAVFLGRRAFGRPSTRLNVESKPEAAKLSPEAEQHVPAAAKEGMQRGLQAAQQAVDQAKQREK